MLRPSLSVRVTTKAELDAALSRADQITVEGDEELLTYAVNKAAGDPGNRISVELGERSSGAQAPAIVNQPAGRYTIGTDIAAHINDVDRPNVSPAFRAALAPPRPPSMAPLTPPPMRSVIAAPTKAPRWGVVGVIIVMLFVLGVGVGLLSLYPFGKPAPPPPTNNATPAAPSSPPAIIEHSGAKPPAGNGSDFWANLPTLLWPLVAIVAIIALFLIARQAISTGNNVTIQWKVTEKVTGRVVITKVRERSPRNSKAA